MMYLQLYVWKTFHFFLVCFITAFEIKLNSIRTIHFVMFYHELINSLLSSLVPLKLLFSLLNFYLQILFMTFTFLIPLLAYFEIKYLGFSIFFALPQYLFYQIIFKIFSNLLNLYHLLLHFYVNFLCSISA